MKRYIEWIVRLRWIVLTATVLLTAFFLANLGNLEVIIDPDETLPQSHPFVQVTRRVEALFGNKFTMVVGITPKQGDAFQPAVLAKVRAITTGLMNTPGVVKSNVLSLSARKAKDIKGTADGLEVRPLMDAVPTTPEQAEAIRKAFRANPAYANSLVSQDERTTVVLAEFKKDPGGFKGIHEKVERIVAPLRDDSTEILIVGQPVFLSLLEQYSQRMAWLFPLAVLIIGLIHYEAFRTIQGLVLPLVTALLAVMWGLGLMSLAKVPMDGFNATTPILILAVAAGHAVQILKRFYEEYHRLSTTSNLTPKEANRRAVIESLSKIGPVMLAAGFIGAASFMSLIVFEIKTIRTFGIFTGLGILSALIIELTFIPALRALLPAPSPRQLKREHTRSFWDRIVLTAADWILLRPRWVVLGALAFTAAMAVGASLVKIDNGSRSLYFPSLQVRKDDAAMNDRMAGTNSLFILVEGKEADAIKNPAVLRAMESTQRLLEQNPKVGKTVSLVDFIKRINMAMNSDDPKFDVIPDSQELIAQYLFLYSTSGEPGDFDTYVDYDYRNAVIQGFMKSDDTPTIDRIKADVTAHNKQAFPSTVTVRIGGNVTSGQALGEVMIRGKVLNMLQIAGVVWLISAILFRSVLGGALVLVPLIMTVISIYGVMGFTGIPLAIATSTIAAMAVGLGADYAIYLTYRLREQMRTAPDEATAVRETMRTAGKAALYVSSAVAGGYLLLVASWGFNIHLWLGTLTSLAMIISSGTALTLYPVLLRWVRPKFVFGGAPAPAKLATETAIVFGLLAALGMAGAGTARAADLTAVQIVERTFVVSKFKDSVGDATFRLINASGQERVRESLGYSKLRTNGVDNMRFTRFTAPPDIKGTATLLMENSAQDDDIWIYLPALKKVRRLVASNKKDSFVGTDFSYGDVIGHKVSDWKHTLVREETVDGQPCYVVESTPANPDVQANSGYSKRISWVRKDNFVTVKGESYDEGGQLLKKFSASELQQLDPALHRWQANRLESLNVQTGHRTVLEFRNTKVNQNVGDDVFTTRYMERER